MSGVVVYIGVWVGEQEMGFILFIYFVFAPQLFVLS